MARHGISVLKLGTFLVLFGLGASIGGAASDTLLTPLVAQDEEDDEPFCEMDECDDGWFGGSCEENEDGNTGCDKETNTLWFDGCRTYVCGEDPN